MNRELTLAELADPAITWDLVVIGGGATGMGIALDAAARGYRLLLVEQYDFGKGTSSRSTKLIHGGVRYLQQGNFSLVLEALKERGILWRNAPQLVGRLAFVVPLYRRWQLLYYGMGLKLYDLLAGKGGGEPSRILTRKQTMEKLPELEAHGLKGGVLYYDGQFDDTRLLISLAQTAVEKGARVVNYMQVTGLLREQQHVTGVMVCDTETQKVYPVKARVVVNATGVFLDTIRKMEDSRVQNRITGSRGTHLVLDREFLPGDHALLIPRTDDGRVLFAVPWHNRVLVGTTEIAVSSYPSEPEASYEEVVFLLEHIGRYLRRSPSIMDIQSVFAGLRPLVHHKGKRATAWLSREHSLHVSPGGVLSVAGGKWTTYRKMAEDTLRLAIKLGKLEHRPCITRGLPLSAYDVPAFGEGEDSASESPMFRQFLAENPSYSELLHPSFPYRVGDVVWAVRHAMARTPEDFLARRSRLLFLDTRAAMQVAPLVTRLMAAELGHSATWEKEMLDAFMFLAQKYLPPGG